MISVLFIQEPAQYIIHCDHTLLYYMNTLHDSANLTVIFYRFTDQSFSVVPQKSPLGTFRV